MDVELDEGLLTNERPGVVGTIEVGTIEVGTIVLGTIVVGTITVPRLHMNVGGVWWLELGIMRGPFIWRGGGGLWHGIKMKRSITICSD